MMKILRFARGYIDFSISGSMPEAFVNLLTEKGVSVWNVKSCEGVLCCRTLALNYKYICKLSRRKNVKVHIIRKHGLPFFLIRNKKRVGIPIGAVCFVLIFTLLSRFIWYVDIYGVEGISYSRAKEVMEELGVYEGAYGHFDSLRNIQTKAMLALGDVSWITLNKDGSTAEVKITESAKDTTENKDIHYNIVAKCDGQVIRADVQKGMAYVNGGDAVTKGNLLIGGFVQTDLGSTILDTAQGAVLAKTEHKERFSVPKRITYSKYEDSCVTRQNADLFGFKLPLELKCTRADADKISFFSESSLDFKGKTAPVSLIKEHVFYLETSSEDVGEKLAEKRFSAERALCELFSYSDKKIIDRIIDKTVDDKNYYYDVEYFCEEDIGEKEEIMLDEDFSYDPSLHIED